MKRKIIAITMMILMLVGCGTADNKKISNADNSTTIKIGVLRTADSLPIYVGDEMDLFKEYGANVELVEFSSASDQSKAIESGAVDGMMTDMVTWLNIKIN